MKRNLSVVLQLFLSSARLQKKRATLTIASLAWGTVTILLLLAFGEGLKRQMMSNDQAMGNNLAIMWPGETSKPYKGLPEGRPIRPRMEDIDYARERLPDRQHQRVALGEAIAGRDLVEGRFGNRRHVCFPGRQILGKRTALLPVAAGCRHCADRSPALRYA